jgi:hypothetical protein
MGMMVAQAKAKSNATATINSAPVVAMSRMVNWPVAYAIAFGGVPIKNSGSSQQRKMREGKLKNSAVKRGKEEGQRAAAGGGDEHEPRMLSGASGDTGQQRKHNVGRCYVGDLFVK